MRKPHIKTVLVIGSGPIVIGQAAEFDYSGTQGCLALKEEGIRVVLLNPNPATVMTDDSCADTVYFEPLSVETVVNIFEREKPDGLLATLGGQTGLNLALKLHEQGLLAAYGVELLGTPIESIQKGEDREQFRALMHQLNEPVPDSEIVHSASEALRFAEQAGYPIIVRPAYTLGGAGGGIADCEKELKAIVENGLAQSPISQCLIEKSIAGFKEIEYEVMRDENDTCITVCNMENIDPVGIHTGDSIVVAPSQTLTDKDYQMLRAASLKIIRALGIIGGCNIQFALDPNSDRYYLIEVNPRVSRSSALASKATGYPIARMAAKLSIGYYLHELKNPVTGYTYASFEPSLDYCIVKFPRWPFDKFFTANRKLGTQMKATGEVMAIERSFEAAVQKAIRSLEIDVAGLEMPVLTGSGEKELWQHVLQADDARLFALFELLRRGETCANLHEKTNIDMFFLKKFEKLVHLEKETKQLSLESLSKETLHRLKMAGFSDETIACYLGAPKEKVTAKRIDWGIKPAYKMVDTCAAEFEAATPYFYSSYCGENEAMPSGQKKVLIIGSGPIRIGQGIEFDYCSVHGAKAVRKQGYEAIIMNNNPETVSTDYATADRLYFEPLSFEDVYAVCALEQPEGVIVTLGGQTGIKLVQELEEAGLPVLGVSADTIDMLEDRERFYAFMNNIGVPHIPGETANDLEDACCRAKATGYPVLLRPSYVIGGQGMALVSSERELTSYLQNHEYSGLFPLLIDHFIEGIEVDVDVLTDGKSIRIAGMFEHVEKAGVHSGDSTAVTPPHTLSADMLTQLEEAAKKIATGVHFRGLFNIQFVVAGDRYYVIEVNPRASRTVPLLAKIYGEPFVEQAVKLMLGCSINELAPPKKQGDFVAVKAPVFSYSKLAGLDPLLGAEMKSTGELLMIGESVEEAFAKVFAPFEEPISLYKPRTEKSVFVALADEHKHDFSEILQKLEEVGCKLVEDDFTKWVESPHACALISVPPLGKRDGANMRMAALAKQLTVISAKETATAMLAYFEQSKKSCKPIQEWHRLRKTEMAGETN
ncbi:carbamoyl-phosphate synthase arginine-specific large chain [Shouchella clausii]|uniref:carbamoyl phosphate synthase large subunit n=1 Tax=Shouchella tritolerans TaxID=2979466 RepID=UPI001B1B4D6F|nr:carbamoyl phosphate synthase large subunit [Shouchella tritolerans]GIN11531.1 carbamoyl-phosphate synthase arginine-specific large chain [Shouchella clausii]